MNHNNTCKTKCQSYELCKQEGIETFLNRIGRCKNCKATVRVGEAKYANRNRAHKQTIQCVETFWKSKPTMSLRYTRGRCPVCGNFPIMVDKWLELHETSVKEKKKEGDGYSAFERKI